VVLLHQKCDVLSVRSIVDVDSDTVLIGTMVGHVFCPRADLHLITSLFQAGELEPGLRRVLTRLLAPGMVMVDAGAHVGLHTLAAARLVGPSGRVLAFEATPSTFDLLGRGLALNELSERVTAYSIALGADVGEVDLHLSPICGHSSIYPLPGDHPIVRVPLQRLDDVLSVGSRVDVVKLDVEGAELDVLRGMARLIDENPGLIMLVEFGPSHLQRVGVSPSDWLEAFVALGFAGFAVEEPSGACRPLAEIDLGAVESVNIAFVRSYSALCAPLLG
jgi:FkbM family methyltransferase